MTQVMETSTTRERYKKLIGSGTDVGTAGIVIGTMMIDIRGALQNRGDIAFRTCRYLCIVCILYYPSAARFNVYYDMTTGFLCSGLVVRNPTSTYMFACVVLMLDSGISILNVVGQARQVTASSHAVTLSFHPQRSWGTLIPMSSERNILAFVSL